MFCIYLKIGTHTMLLIKIENILWYEHKNKEEIYGHISSVSTTVAQYRITFVIMLNTRPYKVLYFEDFHTLIVSKDHLTTLT